ncbi:MAG: extracellular solute-binding protein [Anaerolineae bacterium]|nr:extracellular solute-binding protein [Anaerolineae bacterium]
MLKRIKFACFVLAVGIIFSGCAQFFSTPEPVTIQFAHPEDEAGQYETWAQQFQEQNSHITIELVENSSLSTIAENDVFIASQFDIPQLLAQNSMLPLSSFIEQDEEFELAGFYPNATQVFMSEGKQWAVPFGMDMMVMYYNKDLFDQYHIAYPQIGWTWQDFVERGLGIRDAGAGVFGYALYHENMYAIYEPIMFIYQHGGGIFDDIQTPTRATLNEPLNIEAMEWYAGLMYDHNLAPTPDQASTMARYPWQGIIQNKFGMWLGMWSERGGELWPVAWRMNWGVVPLPQDQVAVSLAMANGVFISTHTTHPDECWLWVKFLSEQMPYYQIPARRALAESKAYELSVGAEFAGIARAAVDGAILVNPDLLGFEQPLEALQEAFEAIRGGEIPAAALDAAQDKSGF